jgi:hypothetical protein
VPGLQYDDHWTSKNVSWMPGISWQLHEAALSRSAIAWNAHYQNNQTRNNRPYVSARLWKNQEVSLHRTAIAWKAHDENHW